MQNANNTSAIKLMTNEESFYQDSSVIMDKSKFDLSKLAKQNEKDIHVLNVVTEGNDHEGEQIFDHDGGSLQKASLNTRQSSVSKKKVRQSLIKAQNDHLWDEEANHLDSLIYDDLDDEGESGN